MTTVANPNKRPNISRQRIYELDMAINDAFRCGKAGRVKELVDMRSAVISNMAVSMTPENTSLIKHTVDSLKSNLKQAETYKTELHNKICATGMNKRMTNSFNSSPRTSGTILRRTG